MVGSFRGIFRRWGVLVGILLLASLSLGCGDDTNGRGGCTVNCGRLGYNINIRVYKFITEEQCREKAEGCRGTFCPPGAESEKDCYKI